ncbi:MULTISPECIES: RidA family protein [Inquilinus]|uniref:Enamine deaminase RidA (YjgF/YER057c/UK114 family) n=1 Tax=Inquilinus ginsengisoli TaxID=363840 RepID=A0ABU1JH09_9PROT|nr:RidA family protein [Inquilinus ginsengisoli]MDR6287900.1 enamine deaminase RidA (YjgF/YER057c/UK114 family) [Inquilinus ginsengisoli]
MTIKRIGVGPRMSAAVIHDGRVFTAGQVADKPTPDVTDQTRQILATIDALLAEAGTDKTKLLTANIWLADIADFAAMNAAWDKWVSPGNTPARATVESKLASPEYRVEIQVTAAI